MNLPSKKLFLVFIPVIVILGIFVLAKEPTAGNQRTATKAGPEVVAVQNSIINETDTDRDGLKDWEETIWKTDPNNPRTHEEYEDDSAYVTAQLALMQNNTSEYTGMGPIENTEDLSKQLFEEYLMLKQTGDVTSEDIARLTDRIRQNISIPDTDSFYSENQLKTFPSSDRQKLQKYADLFSDSVNNYVSIFTAQMQSAGTSIEESMTVGSELYLRLSEELITLEVPSELATLHIQYANGLKESSIGLKEIAGMEDDSLRSIVGTQKHLDGQIMQENAGSSIAVFMNQNGILNFSLPSL